MIVNYDRERTEDALRVQRPCVIHRLDLADGSSLPWDGLVIATGKVDPARTGPVVWFRNAGEGRFDASSLMGKGPGALSMLKLPPRICTRSPEPCAWSSRRVTNRGPGNQPDIYEKPGLRLDFVARELPGVTVEARAADGVTVHRVVTFSDSQAKPTLANGSSDCRSSRPASSK